MESKIDPLVQASPPNLRTAAIAFQRRKFALSLAIMAVGMLISLTWHGVQGWGRGLHYPYDTFLFLPGIRFNDFTYMTLDASRANPYEDPFTPYLPFACLFFRALSGIPYFFSLTAFLFVSLGGMFLLLVAVLDNIVVSPWMRVFMSLSFLALSYPVIISVDRANIEILLASGIAASLFFFSRNRYGTALLWLLPLASFKLYPALFFLLLLRQRKMRLIACAVLALPVVAFLSLIALALPLQTAMELYWRDLTLLNRVYVYENYALEGGASLWNAYKACLLWANHLGLISPIDFSFDGAFIGTSFTIYSCCTAFLAIVLACYVCLVEKEFLRCAMALLLYLSAATPFGGDYRLIYANIALVVLILLKTRRPLDFIILILLALTMVPKKEIILAFMGPTETGFADVSIQVILNPLFIFGALFLLLYDSRASFDWRWTKHRWHRLLRAISPWLSKKKSDLRTTTISA
jgi:hypothetical protein